MTQTEINRLLAAIERLEAKLDAMIAEIRKEGDR